jgi:hypothetical protein
VSDASVKQELEVTCPENEQPTNIGIEPRFEPTEVRTTGTRPWEMAVRQWPLPITTPISAPKGAPELLLPSMGINKNPYVPVIAPPALSVYAHDKNMHPLTFEGWRQILAYQTFHQLYSCAHTGGKSNGTCHTGIRRALAQHLQQPRCGRGTGT